MSAPLADRLRPTTLDEVVGQRHLLAPGKALRSIIESGQIPNLVFYGPAGVGKTTVASIIAKQTNRSLRKLNGTTAGTADIRSIFEEVDTFSAHNGILLIWTRSNILIRNSNKPFWSLSKMEKSL